MKEIHSIKDQLTKLQLRIQKACEKYHRNPKELTLVAVSKTKPNSAIQQAFQHGQLDFGENYVQEWLEKREHFKNKGIRWHFIGHLQSNKCKWVAGQTTLIHSVHSINLLKELEKRTPQKQEVLLQINVGKEHSKGGFTNFEQVLSALTPAHPWQKVQVVGLMAIPPFTPNPENVRPYFQMLREMRDQLQKQTGQALPHLSMGMSHDLESAVAEGATIIRVGTAIFGARQ